MAVLEHLVEVGRMAGLNEIEITAPGITLELALPFLKISPASSEIEEILKAIQGNSETTIFELLNNFCPKTFEELLWFYKSTCALFLLKDGLTDPVQKMHLLERAFLVDIGQYKQRFLFLHVVCKELWNIVDQCGKNIITLCKKLCTISSIGFNVSICLIWGAFFRFFKHPIKIFHFHTFHELVEILASKDVSTLKQNLNATYTLLQLISFLQNTILVKNENNYVPIQHKSYFDYTKRDLKLFRNWCITIRQMFDINLSNEGEINSGYILIYELIELDILYQLENVLLA